MGRHRPAVKEWTDAYAILLLPDVENRQAVDYIGNASSARSARATFPVTTRSPSMSTLRSIAIITALVLMGLFTTARAEQTLTYPDLVGRLTDLARLATLPDRGETCAQWSSYDRASRYDEKTGKYVAWDANGDGGGIIRTRGRPGRHGRDERTGLHLAGLVGRARPGTRQDLPRRPAGAGRRPALRPLLRRQARRPLLSRRCPTTWPPSIPAGRTCTCRSPIRSRARSSPTRTGATTTTSTTRPIRRGPRSRPSASGLPPNTPHH